MKLLKEIKEIYKMSRKSEIYTDFEIKLMGENKELKDKIIDLNKEAARLRGTNYILSTLNDDLGDINTTLNTDIDDLIAKNVKLNGDLGDDKIIKMRQSANIIYLNNEIDTYKADFQFNESLIESMQHKINSLETKNYNRDFSSNFNESHIKEMQKIIDDLEKKLEEATRLNLEQRFNISELEEELDELCSENDDLKKFNSSQRCFIERLERESCQLCLEIDYLSESL